ncbi:MAG: GAF domain-containing protein [Armatimonadota bacterium]
MSDWQYILPARAILGRFADLVLAKVVAVQKALSCVGGLLAALLFTRLLVQLLDWKPSPSCLTFNLAFCCCAASTAGFYNFASFVLTRTLNSLFIASGFISLATTIAVQAIIDTGSFRIYPEKEFMYYGVLYAAGTFCIAALANKTWKSSKTFFSNVQLAAGVAIILAFPAFIFFQLDRLLADDNLFVRTPGTGRLVVLSLCGLLIVAIVVHHCTRRSDNSTLVKCLCSGLLVSSAGRAISVERFDPWWVSSHVLFVLCWVIFLLWATAIYAVAYGKLKESAAENQIFHQISWALVGAQSHIELFQLLVSTTRESTCAEIVSLYIADESGENLHTVAVAGPDTCREFLGRVYKVRSTDPRPGFHSGHTARAFLTGKTQIVEDVFVDVEFVPWRMIARDEGCAASVPVLHRGAAIGVLNAYFSDKQVLTSGRVRLIETIVAAATSSLAIARASVLTDVKNQRIRRAA